MRHWYARDNCLNSQPWQIFNKLQRSVSDTTAGIFKAKALEVSPDMEYVFLSVRQDLRLQGILFISVDCQLFPIFRDSKIKYIDNLC